MQIIIPFLSICIIDRNLISSRTVRGENLLYVSRGLFIYIYPNKQGGTSSMPTPELATREPTLHSPSPTLLTLCLSSSSLKDT